MMRLCMSSSSRRSLGDAPRLLLCDTLNKRNGLKARGNGRCCVGVAGSDESAERRTGSCRATMRDGPSVEPARASGIGVRHELTEPVDLGTRGPRSLRTASCASPMTSIPGPWGPFGRPRCCRHLGSRMSFRKGGFSGLILLGLVSRERFMLFQGLKGKICTCRCQLSKWMDNLEEVGHQIAH